MAASRRIGTEDELRGVIGAPTELVCAKIADRLHTVTRGFVAASPFVCIASAGADGRCDVSPRGDPPGFVRILDDRTLLIPDRPGNRIADTLRNILETGRVGLLFFIPGLDDSFRVNGRAWLTDDPELLGPSAVDARVPRLGIVVEIEEAYTQCSKAFLRSDLWNGEHHRRREEFPTNGEILAALTGQVDADQYDAERAARYARREGFY
jgi:hypothetical protein